MEGNWQESRQASKGGRPWRIPLETLALTFTYKGLRSIRQRAFRQQEVVQVELRRWLCCIRKHQALRSQSLDTHNSLLVKTFRLNIGSTFPCLLQQMHHTAACGWRRRGTPSLSITSPSVIDSFKQLRPSYFSLTKTSHLRFISL